MIEQYDLSFLNLNSILDIIYQNPTGDHGLVAQGTSSYNVGAPILENSNLKGLKLIIEKYIDLYCQKYSAPKLNLINSWFNITSPGSFLKPHCHEESIVSGAFYILTGKHTVPLIFPNEFIYPYSGLLLLFPSELIHYTDEEQDDRIVISFNTNYL